MIYFVSIKIPKLIDVIKFSQAVYIYKNISDLYVHNNSHNTRYSSNLIPTYQRLSISGYSLSNKAPTMRNDQPSFIKDS